MKKILTAALLGLMLTGCASSTEYGECVGIAEERDTGLRYEMSVRNLVIGVVFVETVIVPTWIVLDEVVCPVGKKEQR